MDVNRIIREARLTDMADIMKVMNAAKKIMRQSGNMHQWGEGYPYIKMYNLRKQQIDFYFHPQYIKPEVHNGKLQRSRTEIGDLIMNIVVGGIIADVAPSYRSEVGRLCLQCGSDNIRIWDKHTCPKCQGEMEDTGEKEFWT